MNYHIWESADELIDDELCDVDMTYDRLDVYIGHFSIMRVMKRETGHVMSGVFRHKLFRNTV